MSELFKIILTSSLTIFGGIFVYVFGQVISKFFIEPIHEQHKVIGEISDSLIFYANVYCNLGLLPKDMMDKASDKLRQLATLLQSKTYTIPAYKFFAEIKIVRSLSTIEQASKKLIALSNSLYVPPNKDIDNTAVKNSAIADEIRELLGLPKSENQTLQQKGAEE